MKKTIIVIIIAIVILAAVWLGIRFIIGGPEDTWICENGQWVKHGQPSAPKPTTPCGTTKNINNNINANLNTNKTNTNTQVNTNRQTTGNIIVSEPKPNNEVSSPMTITGKARVFENTFNIRLKEKSGQVLAEDTVMAQSQEVGEFGSFTKQLTFSAPSESEGMLEVFDYSAKDGSVADLVSITVKFNP